MKAAFRIWFNKFKNHRVYIELLNNYFLVVIGVCLVLLVIKNVIYLIFVGLYLFYVFKQSKIVFLFTAIACGIIVCHYLVLENKVKISKNDLQGIIKEIKEEDSYNRLIIKCENKRYIVYDYDKLTLRVGMEVMVYGESIQIDPNRVENGFNYQSYLKHQHIDGVIGIKTLDIVGRGFCLEVVREEVFGYFESSFTGDTLVFLKALVLGDSSSFSEEFNDSLKDNGIIHLFAISGSHITLFVLLLEYLFKKFGVKDRNIKIIIVCFLCFYLLITSFSPSIFRAALMYFVARLNERFEMRLTGLDNASIVFIGLLIYNPYYIYSVGFVLSFIVSFIIILMSSTLSGSSTVKQTFVISTIAMIVTFPIVININYEINFLSPFTNVIYIFLVETVILPISLVLIILPWLQGLYNLLITGFAQSSYFFSKYFNLQVRFGKMDDISIIIYFGLWLLLIRFIRVKKLKQLLIFALVCFLVVICNISKFNNSGEINFLDLYNGESIVITEPYGNCVVIDTGDGKNKAVTTFLKSKGLKTIDLLILTHNHVDHNGEATSIINEFTVNNIIISAYDNSEIKNLPRVVKVKAGDLITSGNLRFEVLHPDKSYVNENDNSLVMYSKIGELRFIFMGDCSVDVEGRFSNLNVDVLKVGHHGSITSSSRDFVSSLKPKYAIIQTGRIKKFGFPHQPVIDNLMKQKVIIYRTDLHYSIKYTYNNRRSVFVVMNQ